ncbi:MAG: response regulator transcription factor [Halobacteriovoraceae bacterium]|jgi:DNA-binding response OmpR family regulator|nr:response regulator transcription factor [Halobacteriovoraceae bacterium]
MPNILLVEDDKSLGPVLEQTLTSEGYKITVCTNLADAKEQDFKVFDLILLDWMLPDGQGLDLLKVINEQLPVIMLTARTDLIDKVLGLESGASDYITKPFEPRELLARIRVQLREQNVISNDNPTDDVTEYVHNELVMNLTERRVFYHKNEITLTKMEFDLLQLLSANPKQIFSREKLLDQVWGYENYPTTRTVDTHVLQLRQKLHNDLINTVRGVGYRFNPDHV